TRGRRPPGLIVIHEWHGLNESVRALVDRFAAEGFVALAPDLYRGEVAADDGRASELMQALETRDVMDQIAECVAALKARGCKAVGVVGFCMGGAMAFASASAVDGLACAVPFYGIPTANYWDPSKVRVPVQAHFARQDAWASAERAETFARGVIENGGEMELHVYDAGHALMREGDPKVYDPTSARAAWTRAIAFLREHLGG
ncbi:MAG: dienelactone hydrolase family protein, partial [Deltaproteobacteria bacterium]